MDVLTLKNMLSAQGTGGGVSMEDLLLSTGFSQPLGPPPQLTPLPPGYTS